MSDATQPSLLKLDLGCGPRKQPGFHGVDKTDFVGVDTVFDLTQGPWPWADESVEEAFASHFLEHLTSQQRCLFMNELWRVLTPGGKCKIIVPHWASCRAYGDPTHQWPPVSEFTFLYLDKEWRAANAPHTDAQVLEWGYNCDFTATGGYSLRQDVEVRNQELQLFAIQNYKEVCQDIIQTVVKMKR